ncbi:hypothetical protein LYNGBM3L_41590 [Moorena producens 3L]|uniref:Uncharacterized protein n=1 Tax=Moorena producens 3L TaxID=489825 RepID=F4XVP7_9CYAN|nr:hypothetical protein LYNGBM3L_41590 [Moorena producens 3L]OLT66285.1 hypothetical protein BI334_15800 [Moorena producens 3L]
MLTLVILGIVKRISPKFFDTEFCPPSPPTLGGTRVNLLLKVPQNWGTNGGLDVANETSQTTSKLKLVLGKYQF